MILREYSVQKCRFSDQNFDLMLIIYLNVNDIFWRSEVGIYRKHTYEYSIQFPAFCLFPVAKSTGAVVT